MNDFEMKIANDKLLALKNNLVSLNKVAVAFSGGVDSALLLAVAHEVLGANAIAITAVSRVIPIREQDEAREFCTQKGIQQYIYSFDELQIPGFSSNNSDRCYHCKKALFTDLLSLTKGLGAFTLVEGSNTDDLKDYRPGLRALQELQVVSPLRDAGLSKAEIRYLAHEFGLKEWNKPSYACLASRFVYGEAITASKLSMVEKAEQLLYDLGLRQFRVRVHGNMARIEVLADDMAVVMANRTLIDRELKEMGFTYTALDLGGYSSGKMNIELNK